MRNKISDERKIIYYSGIAFGVLGVILFYFSIGSDGRSQFYRGPGMDIGSPFFFKRMIAGMICIIIGFVLMIIGSRGTLGSLIFDSERARKEIRSINLSNNDIIVDDGEDEELNKDEVEGKAIYKETIRIRCRNCKILNEDDAKFCKSCGRLI